MPRCWPWQIAIASASAASSGFGLHLRDLHGVSEDILSTFGRPLVRGFRHNGRRGDRVNGCHVDISIGSMRSGVVTIHRFHLSGHRIDLLRVCVCGAYAPRGSGKAEGSARTQNCTNLDTIIIIATLLHCQFLFRNSSKKYFAGIFYVLLCIKNNVYNGARKSAAFYKKKGSNHGE